MTPEGKVKKQIDKILKSYAPHVWYFKPVSAGYGSHGIPDYIGVVMGRFFSVEAKAGKNQPTAIQKRQMAKIAQAHGKAFVINETNLDELDSWLDGRINVVGD